MNKGELVDAIADRVSGQATKKQIDLILSATIDAIVDTVADGDRVTLVGFGTFEARQRKEREGRNPRTGEKMIIPPKTVASFSAGKTFKEKVN
jgi:DNA-binding protein HU-beta